MAVLYRRFRPQKFEEVVGQNHVVSTLRNALNEGKFFHAYLFAGPRGVGKTTLARLLAKALNCENFKNKKDFPCLKCASCLEVVSGAHLDVIEIDAASNRGIDEIRSLRDKVRFTPQRGLYKVYIIDEVHMLTKEAFNALLKTLEEPPEHAVFILATTEPHKLPATIISRCQRFDFRLASEKDLEEVLKKVSQAENIQVEEKALPLLVESAEGSYRDAIRILEQLASAGQNKINREILIKTLGWIEPEAVDKFLSLIEALEPQPIFAALREFKEKGVDWSKLIERLLGQVRDRLLVAVNAGDNEAAERGVALINLLIKAEKQLKDFALPELPLEAALAEWLITFPGKTPAPIVLPHSKSQPSDSDFQEPLGWWQSVVEQLKSYNHSLSGLLRGLNASLERGQLTVEVVYDFHRDKMESSKNRRAIEEAASRILQRPIKLVVLKKQGGSLDKKEISQFFK